MLIDAVTLPHSSKEMPQPSASPFPSWLYPSLFRLSLGCLVLGLLWPFWTRIGLICLAAAPILAALLTALNSHQTHDIRWGAAVAVSLGGLSVFISVWLS